MGNDSSIDKTARVRNSEGKRGHSKIESYIYDNEIQPRDIRPDLHIKSHFKGTAMLAIKP